MSGEYTTEDGHTIRVFSTLYLDWGLEIMRGDETLYYNPSCLSVESYGFKAPEGMEHEEAEEKDALVEWTDEDWVECLKNEAHDFIEGYCDDY